MLRKIVLATVTGLSALITVSPVIAQIPSASTVPIYSYDEVKYFLAVASVNPSVADYRIIDTLPMAYSYCNARRSGLSNMAIQVAQGDQEREIRQSPEQREFRSNFFITITAGAVVYLCPEFNT